VFSLRGHLGESIHRLFQCEIDFCWWANVPCEKRAQGAMKCRVSVRGVLINTLSITQTAVVGLTGMGMGMGMGIEILEDCYLMAV
jgi:hypothetical protein